MCFSHGYVWIKQIKVKEKGTIGKFTYVEFKTQNEKRKKKERRKMWIIEREPIRGKPDYMLTYV